MSFDGNDYVDMGNILGFERREPFSVTLWVKDEGFNNRSWPRLVAKERPDTPREGWLIYRHISENKYGLQRWQTGSVNGIIIS